MWLRSGKDAWCVISCAHEVNTVAQSMLNPHDKRTCGVLREFSWDASAFSPAFAAGKYLKSAASSLAMRSPCSLHFVKASPITDNEFLLAFPASDIYTV